MESITATEVARHFSDVLNRVAYRHEALEIRRGGKPVARLAPVDARVGVKAGELSQLLSSLPSLGDDAEAFAADVESAAATAAPTDPWA